MSALLCNRPIIFALPMPYRLLIVCFLLTLGSTSCKKDVLHWQKAQQLSSHTTHRLNRIFFVNDTLGYIVGGDRFYAADILTTHDGGYNWQQQSFPEAGKELFGITQTSDGTLYTVGFDGKLLSSSDQGKTWLFRQLDYAPYKAIVANRSDHLLLAGGISFESGFTEQMDQGGNHLTSNVYNYELNDMVLLADGTGYISGYGAMMKTKDDGAHWQLQDLTKDNFTAVDVQQANNVWTCGYGGSIYHSGNGGDSWELKRNGNDLTKPRYHLQDILFTDAINGYAVGENGLVIYTDDAGDHWSELDRFTSETLYNIVRCPNGDLLVCGNGGSLYRLLKK